MKSIYSYPTGPVVRISPKSILISDPDTTRKILAVGSKFTRGPWFDSLRLDPYMTNVASERDPKKHQQLRGILSAGVSVIIQYLRGHTNVFSYLEKMCL